MLGKTGKAKRRSGTAWNTKGKGKFTEFLDCLFLSDHCCNYATPRHACAGDCLSGFPAEGWGPRASILGSPHFSRHASEGRAEGISCAFSLSVKSNDFPTLRQSNLNNPSPNGPGSGSGLGIWAPESAHLCLVSSFLFILAHNPGFYTPLSPPNRCPPGLCQIPLFPRTCGEAAGKPAPGSRCLF